MEPVFGQIKQGRGFRQFLLRGLEKVSGEWSLICTGHNLLKLFRCGVDLSGRAPLNRSVHRITDFTESVNTVLSEKRPWSEWLRSAPIGVDCLFSLTRQLRLSILRRAPRGNHI